MNTSNHDLIGKELQPQALRTASEGRPANWLSIVANQESLTCRARGTRRDKCPGADSSLR